MEELCFAYQLKKSPGQNDFYYLDSYGKSKPRILTIVVGKPSSNKGLKPEFIFLFGDFSCLHLDGDDPISFSTKFSFESKAAFITSSVVVLLFPFSFSFLQPI